MKFKKQELIVISYGEIWDRLNYYGLQALLILYLTQHFLLSDQTSYAIYGVYTALSFAFTIAGGIIADKILGFYYSCIIGGLLIAIGNLFLSLPGQEFIYIGLANILTGIGLFKPNNVSLLGNTYSTNLTQRDQAFSIFYMFVNLGSILGPIIYGIAAQRHTYNYGFIFSTLGMVSALLFFYKFKKQIQDVSPSTTHSLTKIISLLTCCIFIAWILLKNTDIFEIALFTSCSISLIFFIKLKNKFSLIEKKAITSLFSPFLTCIIFFSCLLQIYSSLNLFLDRYAKLTIFSWTIPTAWFTSLEPLFIILMVPKLDKIWGILKVLRIEPKPSNKINLGLILSVIGFYLFSLLGSNLTDNKILFLLLIIIGNMLLAISELCIIPVTMSLTNLVSPNGYKGTMIGIFYFTMAISGYFSSTIANYVMSNTANGAISVAHSFAFIAIGLLILFLLKLSYEILYPNKFQESDFRIQ